jgi:hypothetical protein
MSGRVLETLERDMEEKQACLAQLMNTCVTLNRPNFNVWLDYAGHVDWITVRAHAGGYESRMGESFNETVRTGEAFSKERCDLVIDALVAHSEETEKNKDRLLSQKVAQDLAILKNLKEKYPEAA